jgi:hypothetical protein
MASTDDAPQIVLCFDGTGNTLRADGTESNILKIFRMLERTDDKHRMCGRTVCSAGNPMLTSWIYRLLLSTYSHSQFLHEVQYIGLTKE